MPRSTEPEDLPCPCSSSFPERQDTPSTLDLLVEPLSRPVTRWSSSIFRAMTQTRALRSTRTPCAPCSPMTWPMSCWSVTVRRVHGLEDRRGHPDVPVVYIAAWIARDGVSVLDLFAGGDPFEAAKKQGSPPSTGDPRCRPRSCALNIDRYVAAADPSEQDAVRAYLGGRSVRRASPRSPRSGAVNCGPPAAAPMS